MSDIKIAMISSTALDLPEHRKQVISACENQEIFPMAMENLPARDADAIRVSLEMVDKADIYIGIYAHRYGYIPEGYDISITEMEFDHAVKRGIPILIFTIRKDHPLFIEMVEANEVAQKKLEALKNKACLNRGRREFKSPEELRAEIISALSDLKLRELQTAKTPAIPNKADPEQQRQAEQQYLQKLKQDLQQVYTPLAGESRQSRRNSNILLQNNVRGGVLERLAKKAAQNLPEQTQQYQDIQTAFTEVPRAVLLGEPGAGKTTSLHKLAGDGIERARQNPDAAIPLFIRLGEWRTATQSFDSYLAQQLGGLGAYLKPLLQQQRAVLLLDGLNETPTGLREQKAAELKNWLQQHRNPACYVSCRDLDYTAPMSLDLDAILIRPLDPLRIRAFIQDMMGGIQDMMGGQDKTAADRLFWELGGEGLQQTWAVWQQAGATEQQFWFGEDIPRESPDVYHKTTAHQDEIWRDAVHNPRSLLKLASNPFMLSMLVVVYAEHGTLPKNRTALLSWFVDDLLDRENLVEQQGALVSGLQALAWAMQQQQGDIERSVQTTLPRLQALRYMDEPALTQAARANLLDAGDDVRFSHQLLQEYFTALMMREKIANTELDAHSLWPVEKFWKPSGWEEAAVLLAGLYEADCSPVLRWLLPVNPELMVRCIRQSAVPYDDKAIVEELKRYWQQSWLDIKRYPEPEARASIARAFGALDLDQRRGVGLNGQGLPDISWLPIPKGEVSLEDNVGSFPVDDFYLAKYPVTNAQFQCFIDDKDGYANPHWWAGLDAKPGTPATPRWTEANHPRETVSWFEAMAFCAWLSQRLQLDITLPSEAQWQQAASSGRADFDYPWGKDYQSGAANIDETYGEVGTHYLQRTTAVGLYPQGDSLQGVADLSGNVWEWCLNEYAQPDNNQASGSLARVVRGGSWVYYLDFARASYRSYYYRSPGFRSYYLGFRVCCLSPII